MTFTIGENKLYHSRIAKTIYMVDRVQPSASLKAKTCSTAVYVYNCLCLCLQTKVNNKITAVDTTKTE